MRGCLYQLLYIAILECKLQQLKNLKNKKGLINMGRKRRPALTKQGKSETKAELSVRAEAEKRLMGSDDKIKEVPAYLDELEQAYYKYLVTELEISGIIGNLDIGVVEQTAIALSDLRKLDAQLKRDGIIIQQIDRNQNSVMKENPAFGAKQKVLNQYRALTSLLGMSPASRAQLAGMKIEQKEQEEDPLFQVLAGGNK